jgi:hypothetical protein
MVAPKRRKTKTTSAAPRQSWQTVIVPEVVRREAREFLSIGQYVHVTDFVKQLVGFGTQRYDKTMKIAPIEGFWELKEKGGLLGRINVRVYFAFLKDVNQIAILHAYKTEDDSQVHPSVLSLVRHRLRRFLNGELRQGAIVYRGSNRGN